MGLFLIVRLIKVRSNMDYSCQLTHFFFNLCILVSFVTRCVILVAQFRLELAMMELRVQLKVIRGGGGGWGNFNRSHDWVRGDSSFSDLESTHTCVNYHVA